MTADALIEAVARELHHAGWERDYWTECAHKVIAAIEAAGFRVVPVDPTPTMYGAALEDLVPPADAHAAWRSMLSAAPKLTEGT